MVGMTREAAFSKVPPRHALHKHAVRSKRTARTQTAATPRCNAKRLTASASMRNAEATGILQMRDASIREIFNTS
jgi:hypothetical protein